MKAELMILRMVYSNRWFVSGAGLVAGGPATASWNRGRALFELHAGVPQVGGHVERCASRLGAPFGGDACVAAVDRFRCSLHVAGSGCGTRMALAATAVAISSLRTKRNVTGIASNAIAPDTQRAEWNPPVSAARAVSPPRMSVT
jgi:hypothetical protein